MKSFEKSKWIWLACGEGDDQYAEFFDTVEYNGGELLLRISCDSDYAVFLNGEYLASGQYGDFEHYKIYDEIDLTDRLKRGENSFKFLAYHTGVPTSRYRPAARLWRRMRKNKKGSQKGSPEKAIRLF